MSLRDLAQKHHWVREILEDPTTTSRVAARKINERLSTEKIGKTSVNDYRKAYVNREATAEGSREVRPFRDFSEESGFRTSFEPGPDGSVGFETTSEKPLLVQTDWSHVFEKFGLSTNDFVIIDDTVRVSTWQQSKRLDDGSRDIVDLYSYRARFAKKVAGELTEEEYAQILDRVWAPEYEDIPAVSGDPCTFVVCLADLQLGKNEGGGVKATVERFEAALARSVTRIRELRAQGRNIERIAVLNMGDPVEGCDGNYAQQTYTVEINQRDQLVLALNLFLKACLTLEPLAENFTFASVLCNHGEWNRHKGKSFTDDADNAGGFLADTLRMLMEGKSTKFESWDWVIARDEMVITANLSGVDMAMTHGHKMPASSDNIKGENTWLQNQSLGLLHHTGVQPRLWVTAHRHHSMVLDFGPWWRIQCSALDGGSKWFYDSAGKWSTMGVTTFLAGKHDERGFSDYLVL